ncbi:hypothetical protein COAQ111491_13735 [Comamonas aquatilis]
MRNRSICGCRPIIHAIGAATAGATALAVSRCIFCETHPRIGVKRDAIAMTIITAVAGSVNAMTSAAGNVRNAAKEIGTGTGGADAVTATVMGAGMIVMMTKSKG